jgi:tRNA(fMet)-specific endonuclease VapC
MSLALGDVFGIPIVAVEEKDARMSGHRERTTARRQVFANRELSGLFEFFATFPIAAFDQKAAVCFDTLQAAKIRIASRDLKIAAIAMSNNALLLTANRRDFEKVPGLRFENRLE